MSTILTFTEQNIRLFVSEHNVQKGQQHAHDGAIVNLEQPEVTLKAAERAEEANPHASIDLYQQQVERLITGHGLSN